jgi:hypothetical protein
MDTGAGRRADGAPVSARWTAMSEACQGDAGFGWDCGVLQDLAARAAT